MRVGVNTNMDAVGQSSPKMKRGSGVIVATRCLTRPGTRHEIGSVTLYKPRRLGQDHWGCHFRIKGLGDAKLDEAFGVDGVQALLCAIDGVRYALEKSGTQCSWMGVEEKDGGFPRFVPKFLGLRFEEKINKFIDRELVRFKRAAELKRKGGGEIGHSRHSRPK